MISTQTARVYVVVLNWNGFHDTIACLESLLQSVHVNFVAIICDNDSKDGSKLHIAEWAIKSLGAESVASVTQSDVIAGLCLGRETKVAIVSNELNWGFAGGNNVGLRLAMNDATCDFVWLVNNDTIVAPEALSEALLRAASDPQIGICGSTLVYFESNQMVQALGGARFSKATGRSVHIGAFSSLDSVPENPSEVENSLSYVAGAAMLVRRSFIEQVGLMQEDYFLYYEEIDWATRGKSLFKLGYAPRSLVYHKEGASIGTSASGGSALSVYYLFRNRIRFTRRFYPWLLLTVVPACIWDISKLALRGRIALTLAALRGVLMLPRAGSQRKVTQ